MTRAAHHKFNDTRCGRIYRRTKQIICNCAAELTSTPQSAGVNDCRYYEFVFNPNEVIIETKRVVCEYNGRLRATEWRQWRWLTNGLECNIDWSEVRTPEYGMLVV